MHSFQIWASFVEYFWSYDAFCDIQFYTKSCTGSRNYDIAKHVDSKQGNMRVQNLETQIRTGTGQQ